MNLIYKNSYGSSYKVDTYITNNQKRNIQIYIGTIGIYMTEKELSDLLKIIKQADKPCQCEACEGKVCNKIWTSNPLIDICIKLDDEVLDELEDLVSWTKFLIKLDSNLEDNSIISSFN